jgi:hypothetical protein
VAITLQRDFDASAGGLRYLRSLLPQGTLNHRFEVESRRWGFFFTVTCIGDVAPGSTLFGYR